MSKIFAPVKCRSAVFMGMYDKYKLKWGFTMYYEDNVVLCVSNAYEKKYYLNQDFNGLPEHIRNELKIMCVLFTEDVGGIMMLEYDENGTLQIKTEAAEEDILYDEIGAALKIKQIRNEKADLLQSLELYFKVFFLDEDV